MATDSLPAGVRLRLRWLLPGSLREEITGDIRERHAAIASVQGASAARRWARRQVGLLRLVALRRALRQSSGRPGPARGGNGPGLLVGLWQDVVAGLRAIRLRPVAALTVIATVALGIGATTAVFSVVHGILLRPLPFPESERLVEVWQTREDWLESPNHQLRAFASRFPLSVPTFNDWESSDTGLQAVGAFAGRGLVYRSDDGAEVWFGQMATSGMFDALAVPPLLGRTLQAADDALGAPRVAVLSHGLWQDAFAADDGVLGRELVLDGTAHTVVGVMPAGFQSLNGTARLWVPLPDEEKEGPRDSQFLGVVGRLAPGVSPDEALVRIVAVQDRLAEEYPDTQGQSGARAVPLLDSVVGDVGSTLWFLLGTVALVLLVACLNIANLLSVIGLTRRHELAVKAALGAGNLRLVRGLAVESAVLAGVGGVAGVAAAWLGLPLLVRTLPPLPRQDAVGIDPAVIAFGLATTLVAAVVVGALPALQAWRTQPREMLSGTGRGLAGDRAGNRSRSALVVAEIAVASTLLVGAALLASSFARLWSTERGFATEGLVALDIVPDPAEYPEHEDRDRFLQDLGDRLGALPGVSVSATNQAPLSGSTSSTTTQIERGEAEPEEMTALVSIVLDYYLDVMGIPLVEGRGFGPDDVDTAPPVALVNEAMARRVWPDEPAIGKLLRDDSDEPWRTVVGVVRNVRHQGLNVDIEPKVYYPALQSSRFPDTWVLRIQGDIGAVIDLARDAVAGVSPTTPVRRTEILEERIARSVAVPRFRALFVVGLAAMAGVLALLGIFSVVALTVAQRTREIGLRMALGARAGHIVGRTVGAGVRLALLGVALGLALALPASRFVSEFLFQVEPTDPVIYGSIAITVSVVSALAAYLPARRAAAVNPVAALNDE